MENTSLAIVKTKMKKMVISLIERALCGAVTLDEFYSIWPKELESDKFYNEIYRALENAIEHFPGDFFTGKPKLDFFTNSKEYQVLKEHLKKLNE
jgi:hypothetical protein